MELRHFTVGYEKQCQRSQSQLSLRSPWALAVDSHGLQAPMQCVMRAVASGIDDAREGGWKRLVDDDKDDGREGNMGVSSRLPSPPFCFLEAERAISPWPDSLMLAVRFGQLCLAAAGGRSDRRVGLRQDSDAANSVASATNVSFSHISNSIRESVGHRALTVNRRGQEEHGVSGPVPALLGRAKLPNQGPDALAP